MINKIRPRHHMYEQPRIPRIPRRHPLHVRGQRRVSIQRLPFLHLIHHLPHIHIDLSLVFRKPIKPFYTNPKSPMLASIIRCPHLSLGGRDVSYVSSDCRTIQNHQLSQQAPRLALSKRTPLCQRVKVRLVPRGASRTGRPRRR